MNLRKLILPPAIQTGSTDVRFESDIAPELHIKGRLWGGNLAMLCHLVGTEFMPQIDDGVLFLEDVAEHPYRVERMLLQLKMAGVLDRQKAIILGDFSAYQLAAHDNGYDFAAMVLIRALAVRFAYLYWSAIWTLR